MSVADRLKNITKELPGHCKLIAVTKTHPADIILEAYNAGHRIMGENKVQELVGKYEELPRDIEWHLIGHLQSNKVKFIAPFVSLIHSIDSVKLLQEVNKQAEKNSRQINCLLQVHIAEEESKFGFSPEELFDVFEKSRIESLHAVRIIGLMGMATLTEDQEQIRREFRGLKKLFNQLGSMQLPANTAMIELSMGMSSDYSIAIEEGSTMVRIGSAIFGNRNYQS
jgi:PLP dependent protein